MQPQLGEQLGMCTSTDKNHEVAFAIAMQFVYQQKITANMTLSMTIPITAKGMIQPFWVQWRIIRDEKKHRLF
jgi:hypothetical protein